MNKPILFLLSAAIAACISANAAAQGISNARDGNGNLVDRGAATRTYSAAPMTNTAVEPKSPQGSAGTAPSRTVVIKRRP